MEAPGTRDTAANQPFDDRKPRLGRRRLLPAVFLVLLLWPGLAHAGRPLETEDPGTVEPGHVELEVSQDWVRFSTDDTWTSKAVVAFGVLPGLELRLEAPFPVIEPELGPSEAGVGDVVFGAKYRLLEETPAFPAVLAGLALRLPTGDEERGLGAGDPGVGVVIAASKAIGHVTFITNVGYTFEIAGRTLDAWTLAGAVEYRVRPEWSLVAEAIATLPNSRDPHLIVVRAGAVYAFSDFMRLDAAVGVGATRESPDVAVTVGVTFSF